MAGKRLFTAVVLGVLAFVVSGCGPHAYLKDYFADNGGFAYMNPPRNLEGPGTIVQLQDEGMLTVFAKDSAFPDIPILPGDMQFADFDTRTEWRGSLSLAFDFVSSGASPGKLKAALVTAGARSAKFRFGPARKKVVELGRLVQAIQNGELSPVAVEFLKNPYCGVIVGVAEVSEMSFDFSDIDNFQFQVDAELLEGLGSLTGGKCAFASAGSKAFKIEFKDTPLYVGYYLWQPKFTEDGQIIPASAKTEDQLLYVSEIKRLQKEKP